MLKKFRYHLITLIIVLFTIIIYAFTDNGALYLPLVFFMYISPCLFLFAQHKKSKKTELLLWGIIPLMFLSYLRFPSTFRVSTVVYSSLFILVFLLYNRLLQLRSLSIFRYRKILTRIIYAYFFVLVLQQAGFVLGFPIINKNFADAGFKLNSLSYEASYVATLLPLLMLSYVRTDNILLQKDFALLEHIKKEPKLWFAFLYTIFTCGASTIFFTFPIFILFFFRKNLSVASILSFIIIGVGAFYLISSFNSTLFDRQAKLMPGLLSFDSKKIIETDASAATRIIPMIEFLKSLLSPDVNLLFGNGVDYGEKFFTSLILDDSSRKVGAGGMAAFVLDYGLVTGILFIIAVIKLTSRKLFSYENLFYFTCFFIFGFNNYLTWAYLIFMSTNKYFDNEFKIE